jgi:hypothetical protein
MNMHIYAVAKFLVMTANYIYRETNNQRLTRLSRMSGTDRWHPTPDVGRKYALWIHSERERLSFLPHRE